MDGASAALELAQGISELDLQRWRKAGYAAIDRMINSLSTKVAGHEDVERVSSVLEQESKDVTAAVFGQILSTLGAAELTSKSCPCPECGKMLRSPRNLRRSIDTLYGRIAVQRPYFYCRPCHRGTIPFDIKLGLAPSYKQYDLQKKAARLFADVPYERAAELFKELTGCDVSNHTMHDMAKGLAEASEIAQVLPSRHAIEKLIEENSRSAVWRPIVVVSADGAHIPTRPDVQSRDKKRGPGEWREAKGFRIYMIAQDRIVQLMSWHQIMDDKEFGEALGFASTLIPQDKVRLALVADGALWIWKHMAVAFPGGKEILDYYHCSEHIHKLAEKQYRDDKERQAAWIETTMARLNEGEVEAVIWGLQRMNPPNADTHAEIERLITYLRNNAHRIDDKKSQTRTIPSRIGSNRIRKQVYLPRTDEKIRGMVVCDQW